MVNKKMYEVTKEPQHQIISTTEHTEYTERAASGFFRVFLVFRGQAVCWGSLDHSNRRAAASDCGRCGRKPSQINSPAPQVIAESATLNAGK